MIVIKNIRYKKGKLGRRVQKLIAKDLENYMSKKYKSTKTTGDFLVR